MIRAEKAILKRSAVEAADDGFHLFVVRRFDEGETLGLLSLGVANDLDVIEHEVFRGKPGFDIVLCYPGREISEENGKAHLIVVFCSVGKIRGAPQR